MDRGSKLKELLDGYRRMHMGELLTENIERIAYLEGVIDGLELAMEVLKATGKEVQDGGQNGKE